MTTEIKDALMLEGQDIFARLTLIHDYFISISKSSSPTLVEAKKIRCDALQQDLKDLRLRIYKFDGSVTDPKGKINFKVEQFDNLIDIITDKYLHFQKALSARAQPAGGSSNANTSTSSSIALPKIQIPKFDGKVEEWQNFKALYDSLIHNNVNLPDIQKFQLLKSHLQDEASTLIANIKLDDVNYLQAYNTLVDRYSNPRRLIHYYLHQVLQYKCNDSKSYSKFISAHVSSIQAIKNLNLTDVTDTVLFCLSYQNLNAKDKHEFDNTVSAGTVPKCDDLFDFIKKKAQSYELSEDVQISSQTKHSSQTQKKRTVSLIANKVKKDAKVNPSVCPVCKGDHKIYTCTQFSGMNLSDKRDKLTSLRRCFICLGFHSDSCSTTFTCRVCNSKSHHTLLHSEEVKPGESKSAEKVSMITSNCNNSTVLLSTIEVEIQDSVGGYYKTKAVVDNGSMVNAVSTQLAKRLGLKSIKSETAVHGFGLTSSNSSKVTKFVLRSPYQWRTKLECSALVMDNLCPNLPTTELPENVIKYCKGFKLADKTFFQPSRIELLLGAEIFANILKPEHPITREGYPTALSSSFGFILSGKIKTSTEKNNSPISLLAHSEPDVLDETLRAFWEQEEIQMPKPSSPEDVLAEEHFNGSFSRTPEGRFQVRLCFKPEASPLGSNREIALKRFFNLEKKLSKDPACKMVYDGFFQEYKDLNHMSVANNSVEFILPHHAIYKPLSSSSKIRAVFDASSVDNFNASLNSKLVVGPKLQKDLPAIIDSFRSHNIAVCCDIQKMYRNISLAPEDRHFQHIFWRPSMDEKVCEYELNTLTYGLSSAPFLAQRCIQELATDEGKSYPLASHSLTHHCYIDDVITGQTSVQTAKQLQHELIELLGSACFKIKKWSSNSEDVLSSLSKEDRETPITFSDDKVGVKILGLIWTPQTDEFSYDVLPFEGDVTKRSVLSYISRIFDCNGFLSPVILKSKLFIQKLWLLGLSWDGQVPEPLYSEWKKFVVEFPLLSRVRIPRRIFYPGATFRLVGMCDASQDGMGCVVYLHVSSSNFSKCHLLRSKTKVAPLKSLTIPRAELVSALMVTKLMKLVLNESFPFPVKEVLYFTDSKTVLSWLQTPPHLLKIFVSNRVVQILDSTKPDQWFHVSTSDNSSDICSRGASPSQLLDSQLYWEGPTFLQQPYENWSLRKPSVSSDETPELKKQDISLFTVNQDNVFVQLMDKVSSLSKLQRIVSYVLRFITALKTKVPVVKGPVSTIELNTALEVCISISQKQYFQEEIENIKRNKVSNSLRKLSPFLAETGIVKVGGRLQNSSVKEEMKHPILLHAKSRLAFLLCNFYHQYTLHAGVATVQALIQMKYWIPSLRTLIKRITSSCVRCYRLRAKPASPYMAPLPASRVTPSAPFTHTGVDFCGFFEVKESLRRNSRSYKVYAAIFCCFTTRAVHIELVSSLSSDAFKASFERFSSRRGLPAVVHSDRGTNFVGAAREFREIQRWLSDNHEDIFSSLAAKGIKFEFNCPTAASMGGVWEIMVKQAKTLLHRFVGDQKFTFEELSTIFTRIEAVLNSRPLVYLKCTPDDEVDYLSPGHFLIGRPILAFPEYQLPEDMKFQSRWQRVRQLIQAFWKRWMNQYLHTMQQRNKWCKPQKNLEKDQLVWLSDVKTSPLAWPIGRVIETFPGKDQVVRVAKIKTLNGEYVRPVNKLVVIPIN